MRSASSNTTSRVMPGSAPQATGGVTSVPSTKANRLLAVASAQ
jgi:hypothetical protein